MLKGSEDDGLLKAIRAVARSEAFFSPAISFAVLTDYQKHVSNPVDLLTSREHEILAMIAEGKAHKEIATILEPERLYGRVAQGQCHGETESPQYWRHRSFRAS